MDSTTQQLVHTFGALADLGQEIANTSDFNEMVRTSLHLLLGTLAIRRGAVLECLPDVDLAVCIASWGADQDYRPRFVLDEADRRALLIEPVSIVSDAASSTCTGVLPEYQDELEEHQFEVILPMVVQGRLAGLVLLGKKASAEPFTTNDLEIVRSMVRHIGVGIHTHRLLSEVEQRAAENRRLYDELRTIYADTVRAFAAAIDIKDKYTQGHSERVGKYSEVIAREMGWTEEEVEGIKIAGYLHDVGKLVVERDIINAPYKIDAKSSKELNRHPAAGYEILSPIHHPYADIPLMAKYHHERIDGTGYPEGLSGDQIPLGAKIVSLADSFDAMTTDRPYKKRRSLEAVIEDFRLNSGKQFDQAVVLAFCRALLRELNGEVAEQRIMRLLGKGYVDSQQALVLLAELIADLDPQKQTAAASTQ
jgi:HD-GYP domain-containing protein (c-di-GMP phosphodiesterase class II)